MSKGYVVYPLTKQPREAVIDEALIRECIYLAPAPPTEEERLRIVGNREEALLKEKTKAAVASMGFHQVSTLLMSFRRIGRIENLVGLTHLTKLCLDNNHIEKIENIDHLTSLEWLDLSFNQIRVIEGLDKLTGLQQLSLYANELSSTAGLEDLKQLSVLSLGNNSGLDNLDETTRHLHRLRALRVLTLKGCRVASNPHYRSKVLAFVPTLRFLDGRALTTHDMQQAREEQRENLLPIDEEDERLAITEKEQAETTKALRDYERFNCPDETKLWDELLALQPEGRNMVALLRSDIVISQTKETLDRYQTEFNEAVKDLAEAMKAIRVRRDADDRAYQAALAQYNASNTSQCRKLIKSFEEAMKVHRAKGITRIAAEPLPPGAAASLRHDLHQLQCALLDKEAEQYDTFGALNAGTVAKWKSDAVDVLLQSSFETLQKTDGDFQVALRQVLDSIFEQRQRKDQPSDDFYYSAKQDESVAALLDNKEEYQKVLAEWFEMRRKRLEDLELHHLRAEEQLLTERVTRIADAEQNRHRGRLNEILDYMDSMSTEIESCGSS